MNALDFLSIISEVDNKIEAGYKASVYEDRFSYFNESSLTCMKYLKDPELSESYGILDMLWNRICECMFQIEWLLYSTEQKQQAAEMYTLVKSAFTNIREPRAMSYFAMAHGFWLLMDSPKKESEQDLKNVAGYYALVIKNKDKLKTDWCGAVPYSYYSLGMMFMYGWGVIKDSEMARLFLEQAQNHGMDCQTQIDSLRD